MQLITRIKVVYIVLDTFWEPHHSKSSIHRLKYTRYSLYNSKHKRIIYRSVPSHLSFTRIGQAPNKDLRPNLTIFLFYEKYSHQNLCYSNRLNTGQKLWNINICLSVVFKFLKFWNLRKGRNPCGICAGSVRDQCGISAGSVRDLCGIRAKHVPQEINCFVLLLFFLI